MNEQIKSGADHHAGTGYSESTKEKYRAAVEERIKTIENNIKIQTKSRIDKLAIEAGFEYNPSDCNFYVNDSVQYINKEINRLIELVVLECCYLIEKEGMNMMPGYLMRLTVPTEIDLIKKHFGIK